MASTTLLKNLPEGDAIVQCGDFTEDGTEGIKDLPENVHFLQNRGIVIDSEFCNNLY